MQKNVMLRAEGVYSDFNTSVGVTFQQPVDKRKDRTSVIAGLVFRMQEQISSLTDKIGYIFEIDSVNQEVILGYCDREGNLLDQIAIKKLSISVAERYKLCVLTSGSHIQCFINRSSNSYPLIDIVDETFKDGLIYTVENSKTPVLQNLSINSYQESTTSLPTYCNPILPNVADPDVLLHAGTYYLYSTTPALNVGGIKVYTSTDLVHWTDKGLAMKMGLNNWGKSGFWAPDLIERDGRFYMYYTANEHLCVAVSSSPLGPFLQPHRGPLHEEIKEIDAHAFKDDDGTYYLYFVRFSDGNNIWGAKLNEDMLSIDESTLTELLIPSQPWEKDMANINEGPYMLKRDKVFYLTYSGSHFESPMYGAGYATSTSPLGEYQKYVNNPIMQSNSLVHGTGHHGITTSPDGKELFMVYHCHHSIHDTEPRAFNIDRMRFTSDSNTKTVLEVDGPTITPRPIPSGSTDADNFIEVDSKALSEVIDVDRLIDASKLPDMVPIISSKSVPGKSLFAKVNWNCTQTESVNDSDDWVTGMIELPNNVTNIGKLSLGLKIRVKRN